MNSPVSASRSQTLAFLSLDDRSPRSPPAPASPDAAASTRVSSGVSDSGPHSPTSPALPSPPASDGRPPPTRSDVKAARERVQAEYEYTLSTYTHFLSFGPPLSVAELRTDIRARAFAWMDCATINGGSYVWTTLMTALIIASFVCILMQSFPQYREPGQEHSTPNDAMNDVQLAVLAVFSVQFIVRCVCVDAYVRLQCRQAPVRPPPSIAYIQLIFFTRPFNVIDLAAIVPFWFSVAGLISDSFSIVLILRIIRVLLLSRLLSGRIARALVMFARVVRRSSDVLELMVIYLVVGMIIFAPLMFYAEQGTYDYATGLYMRPTYTGDVSGNTEVSPFTSIPQSFYWVLVTMSTVGYGDLYPTTGGGKVVASLCILCGVVMIAMPISIIGTTFTREYDEERARVQLYSEQARDLRLERDAAERLHAASSTGLKRAMSSRSMQGEMSVRAPRRMLNRMRSMSTEMFEVLHTQLTTHLKIGLDNPAQAAPVKEHTTAEERAAAALLAQCSSEEAKVAVLLSAAARDDAERVLNLLDTGVSASSADYDKRSGLHVAASEGSLAVVHCLIQRGAEVNALDRFGHTPLDDALKHGDPDVIHALQEAHAVHSDTYERELHVSPEAAIAAQLLVEAASEEARVALLLFAASRDDVERCRMLLDSGVLPSAMDYDRRSALHVAASDAAVAVVRLLVQRRADVNATDRWHRTPLDDAVTSGARESVITLERAGAVHSESFLAASPTPSSSSPLFSQQPPPPALAERPGHSLPVIKEGPSSILLEIWDVDEKR